jgi:triacylglycerol lipase
MSSVIAVPELITTAATDLANIGSTLSGAHTAAAASTVTVLPAAEDEVSVAIADLFSRRRPTTGRGCQRRVRWRCWAMRH